MRRLDSHGHGLRVASYVGQPRSKLRQTIASVRKFALPGDLAAAVENANLMPLGTPVDAGKPFDHVRGHDFSHQSSTSRRDACRHLYWRSRAQTSYWASVATARRGTCPQLVLRARVLCWLLPTVGPPGQRSSRKPPGAGERYRCYVVDDRPWQGPAPPMVIYRYAEDRRGQHVKEHLDGFHGVLQV